MTQHTQVPRGVPASGGRLPVPGGERAVLAHLRRGAAPAAILDDDGELFSFKDRNPASTLHYLVIPRRFIRDASRLTAEDLELVGQMEAKARLLIQRDVGHTFDPTELALGFHWPPW